MLLLELRPTLAAAPAKISKSAYSCKAAPSSVVVCILRPIVLLTRLSNLKLDRSTFGDCRNDIYDGYLRMGIGNWHGFPFRLRSLVGFSVGPGVPGNHAIGYWGFA